MRRARLKRTSSKARSHRLDAVRQQRHSIRAGVLLLQASDDFGDYYLNVAESKPEREKYKRFSEEARKLAVQVSGKSTRWLGSQGFVNYFDDDEQDYVVNAHVNEILMMAEDELKNANASHNVISAVRKM